MKIKVCFGLTPGRLFGRRSAVNCSVLSLVGTPHRHNSCHLHLLTTGCDLWLSEGRTFRNNYPSSFLCFFLFFFNSLLDEFMPPLKTSGVFIQLNSPLSGSGVVQFLFCLYLSSLWACARSGLESLSALLFIALCSSLRIRPWDRLMKSGLKSSKASWCEGEVGVKREIKWAACWLNKYSATYRHLRRGKSWGESVHSVLKSILKTSLICWLTLENPPRSLVTVGRWRRYSNIMPGSVGIEVRALLAGADGILSRLTNLPRSLTHGA